MASEQESSSRAAQGFSRRRRRVVHDDVEALAARAEALVQLGELSADRQALEGASLAPGNSATLAAILQDPIPADLVDVVPAQHRRA